MRGVRSDASQCGEVLSACVLHDATQNGPRRDGPRERLAREGVRGLADAELLALLLRVGTRESGSVVLAGRLLEQSGGLASLAGASTAALERMRGVGPAKAASLLAAFELGRRVASAPLDRGRPIRSPQDVQRHYAPRLRGRLRESFHVLILDGRHRLVAVEEVSVGTLTSSLVHPREVFREAIRSAAAAVLLVHHHPSGDPTPSAEDRAVTDRLAAAGELLGIAVVDHVVVADGGYFSFREAGWRISAGAGGAPMGQG